MIKVCSQEDCDTFIHQCKDLLNGCKILWEAGENILPTLPYSSDLSTRAPRSILGLKFSISSLLKKILFSYKLSLYNFTLMLFQMITRFELLNKWYGVDLGLQEFQMQYTMRRSTSTLLLGLENSALGNHNKNWYKNILVEGRDCKGDISGVRVHSTPSMDLKCDNTSSTMSKHSAMLDEVHMQFHPPCFEESIVI
ncbi:hypothetical protein DVH24_039146 [Malus domestica]|uniref:Uncharacterized protein n=1 Tax=Malus domestica TaxID=3750 RepID=A0A498KH32_MALDO|nr:hypothetical protein DVH24_039146 [Malus domestica]